MEPWLPGVHAAPNIQGDAELYEIENRALDPDGLIRDALRGIRDWRGRLVCDLGAGAGYWIRDFLDARHVFAVEPAPELRRLAHARVADQGWSASVLAGSAERTHLADASVDFVHVRFAYFWGPGAEAGLAEVRRILRPGGAFVMIDNDLREGTFARWLSRLERPRDADAVDAWWAAQGCSATAVRTCWRFERREDLEAVVRLELPPIADSVLAEHEGLEVDYGYRLWWWVKP